MFVTAFSRVPWCTKLLFDRLQFAYYNRDDAEFFIASAIKKIYSSPKLRAIV